MPYKDPEKKKAYDKAYQKNYHETHREEKKAYDKAYRDTHREESKAYGKAHHDTHREEDKAYDKAYRETHREEKNAYNKAWHNANREEKNANSKAWRKANPEKVRAYNRRYQRERRATDPVFKFKKGVRDLIRGACKRRGFKKNDKTEVYLCCTYSEFEDHIKKQFAPGMTFENYGSYWEYDHIIPLASAKTEADVIRLSHHTNLQPLTKEDNRRKGAKIVK